MNTDADPALPELLTLVGALIVAAGTYVPWIVRTSGQDVVVQIYVSGMEWGIAGQDYFVLGILAVGLTAAGWYRHEPRGGYVVLATGVGVVLSTVAYLAATLSGGGVSLGAFVPGLGAYLTVGGGLLLVVAGWRHTETGDDGSGAADGTETPG